MFSVKQSDHFFACSRLAPSLCPNNTVSLWQYVLSRLKWKNVWAFFHFQGLLSQQHCVIMTICLLSLVKVDSYKYLSSVKQSDHFLHAQDWRQAFVPTTLRHYDNISTKFGWSRLKWNFFWTTVGAFFSILKIGGMLFVPTTLCCYGNLST